METFAAETRSDDSTNDDGNDLPEEDETIDVTTHDSNSASSQEPRSSQYFTAQEDVNSGDNGKDSNLGETSETDDIFAAAKEFLEEEGVSKTIEIKDDRFAAARNFLEDEDVSSTDGLKDDEEIAATTEGNGLLDEDDDDNDKDTSPCLEDNGLRDNDEKDTSPSMDEIGPTLTKGSSKNVERGIVYLSSIPTAMDLQQIRAALSNCGKLGRVFLQEDHNSKKRAKRTYYSEGWVEFKSKKDAKRAAKLLNCSLVGGKKRHPWFADTWHIKYLPKFKWHHLVDRLAYERAVEEQKMRIEVGAARKEAHHFRELADKADGDKRAVKKGKDINRREWQFYQKQTEEEIKRVIEKKGPKGDDSTTFTGKKKRKNGEGGGVGGGSGGGGVEKRSKREIVDEKKTKKRALIKSIFQGGDSDDE